MVISRMLLLMVSCVFLSACGEDSGGESTASAPRSSVLYKDSIVLSSGYSLKVSGRLMSYQLQIKQDGMFDRYDFVSANDVVSAEGEVGAAMSRLGYSREIRKESSGVMVVRYAKKGETPVYVTYEAVDKKDQRSFKSTVKVLYKNI